MDKTRKRFYGQNYRQRLNVIRFLFEEIADSVNSRDEEKVVEAFLWEIGKIKVATDAAHDLLDDLEDELRSKFQFEEMEACSPNQKSEAVSL